MELSKYLRNNRLLVWVVPNAKSTYLIEDNGRLKIYLHAPPEKDKANKELIKFFKKEFNLRVNLVSGAKSREKVVLIQR